MKVNDIRADGSIDAEPDHFDGHIRIGLSNALRIAGEQNRIVRFEWNGCPLAVAADTDLDLILRQWESRKPGDPLVEIGPHPDPDTTPEYSHGVFVVQLGTCMVIGRKDDMSNPWTDAEGNPDWDAYASEMEDLGDGRSISRGYGGCATCDGGGCGDCR